MYLVMCISVPPLNYSQIYFPTHSFVSCLVLLNTWTPVCAVHAFLVGDTIHGSMLGLLQAIFLKILTLPPPKAMSCAQLLRYGNSWLPFHSARMLMGLIVCQPQSCRELLQTAVLSCPSESVCSALPHHLAFNSLISSCTEREEAGRKGR